jgi:hypothetical protein
MGYDTIRTFDLENDNENPKEEEDSPIDYFLQSTAWMPFHSGFVS